MGLASAGPFATRRAPRPTRAPRRRGPRCGEVPEWSNGAVSKTVVRSRVPRVRIPPSPPRTLDREHSLREMRALTGMARSELRRGHGETVDRTAVPARPGGDHVAAGAAARADRRGDRWRDPATRAETAILAQAGVRTGCRAQHRFAGLPGADRFGPPGLARAQRGLCGGEYRHRAQGWRGRARTPQRALGGNAQGAATGDSRSALPLSARLASIPLSVHRRPVRSHAVPDRRVARGEPHGAGRQRGRIVVDRYRRGG